MNVKELRAVMDKALREEGLEEQRLLLVPPTLDGLITAYRRDKEQLGWLAHPHERHAWDFLLKWRENPDPSIHVPKMLPNGRIV
jgi:hypothetical protein